MTSKRSRTMHKLRTMYDTFALANGEPTWDQLSQDQRSAIIYIAAHTSVDRHKLDNEHNINQITTPTQ